MDHQRRADLMLLLATSFWGISNCLTAICLRDMQPLTLNAFRFITAFLVLGFVFRKNLRRVSLVTVKYSILVGLSLVIVYTSLTYGVMYTSVSNAGFIGALSVVTTPILEFIVYRKKPEKKFGVSMVLCLVGLALMTLSETLKPAFGDVICLFAAVFYSVDLMITERAVADERVDPLALGVCDLAVVGVVITVLSVFLETPALPGTAKVWAASLFLGIVCSGICLVIQSVFQRHTTASRASLIFTLEPVFSAIFAFFLLGERIGVRGYLGAALMLASLVLVEVWLRRCKVELVAFYAAWRYTGRIKANGGYAHDAGRKAEDAARLARLIAGAARRGAECFATGRQQVGMRRRSARPRQAARHLHLFCRDDRLPHLGT